MELCSEACLHHSSSEPGDPLLLLQHSRRYCLRKAGLPETTPPEKSHLRFTGKEETELIGKAHQPRAFHPWHKSKTLMSQAIDPSHAGKHTCILKTPGQTWDADRPDTTAPSSQ